MSEKEIRILVTPPEGWDSEDIQDLEDDLRSTMSRHLGGWDFTIGMWDVR